MTTTAANDRVLVSHERARGCGFRKPGKDGLGVYLVGDGIPISCARLPHDLTRCPTCGGGIKPSRGWTWIIPRELFGVVIRGDDDTDPRNVTLTPPCIAPDDPPTTPNDRPKPRCITCKLGLGAPKGRHGLLWIGEQFYATPDDFEREAGRMGISRKLAALPRGFELGSTVVYLAHRKARWEYDADVDEAEPIPGIFMAFMPRHVDLVIASAQNVPERAFKLADQIGDGARIIEVVPSEPEQKELVE